MARQWLRKCSLIVADQAGNGQELSQLRVHFQVRHSVIETPNTLIVRVYNLSPTTRKRIEKEFTQVVLQAGYEGNFGRIFQGTIKQVFRGREDPVNDYVDIFCADADIAHNWGVINRTLAAGYTQDQIYDAVAQSFAKYQVQPGKKPDELSQTPQAPRGRVLWGMSRDEARRLAEDNNMSWSLNSNELSFLPLTAYKPGEEVVLSTDTGMIGVPQQTQDGIQVSCLLNPAIGAGQRLKIANKPNGESPIAQFTRAGPASLDFTAKDLPPSTDANGEYKVLYVDHIGETRGNSWYSNIVCLSVDPTAIQPISRSVLGVTGAGA